MDLSSKQARRGGSSFEVRILGGVSLDMRLLVM